MSKIAFIGLDSLDFSPLGVGFLSKSTAKLQQLSHIKKRKIPHSSKMP